ncbi:MAG: hypothetical protein V4695_13265 [Pseudomonadota bacterium]
MDELRWMVGLNIVLAIWLGMLADTWKGRRLYVWMAIGFATSLLGLALLAWLPKVERRKRAGNTALSYDSTEGYSSESESGTIVVR